MLEHSPSRLSLFLQSHVTLQHRVHTSAASIQQQAIKNSTDDLNNQHRPVSTQGSSRKPPMPESRSKTKGKQQSICEDANLQATKCYVDTQNETN